MKSAPLYHLLLATFSLLGYASAQEDRNGCFPGCVSLDGDGCKALIEGSAPDLRGNVYVFPWNSMMTMDYRTDRVRIIVNDEGTVENKPCRG